MYCPECGTQNDDSSLFCENCGTSLQFQEEPAPVTVGGSVAETPVETPVYYGGNDYAPVTDQPAENGNETEPGQPAITEGQKYLDRINNGGAPVSVAPKKPISKQTKIIIGVIAGVLVALIAVIAILSSVFTPEKTAENYFKALSEGDYAKMYSYIIDHEKQFVSEDEFVEYMKANTYIEPGSIDSFDCRDASSVGQYSGSSGNASWASSSDLYSCNIYFNVSGQLYEDDMNIDVVGIGSIIPAYKVSIMDNLVENVEICSLEGATVTIGSRPLAIVENTDDYYDEGIVYYVADVLLEGYHTITIEHEMYDTIETQIYVSDYDSYFYYTDMALKEETRNEIFTQSTDVFKSMCAAAMSSQDFSAVSGNFTDNPDKYSYLVNDYSYFKRTLKDDDGEGFTSLNFTSFTDATGDFEVYDNTYTCKVSFSYDYVYIYSDFFSSTGYSQTSETDANGYIYFEFELQDGEWKISEIGDYNI